MVNNTEYIFRKEAKYLKQLKLLYIIMTIFGISMLVILTYFFKLSFENTSVPKSLQYSYYPALLMLIIFFILFHVAIRRKKSTVLIINEGEIFYRYKLKKINMMMLNNIQNIEEVVDDKNKICLIKIKSNNNDFIIENFYDLLKVKSLLLSNDIDFKKNITTVKI